MSIFPSDLLPSKKTITLEQLTTILQKCLNNLITIDLCDIHIDMSLVLCEDSNKLPFEGPLETFKNTLMQGRKMKRLVLDFAFLAKIQYSMSKIHALLPFVEIQMRHQILFSPNCQNFRQAILVLQNPPNQNADSNQPNQIFLVTDAVTGAVLVHELTVNLRGNQVNETSLVMVKRQDNSVIGWIDFGNSDDAAQFSTHMLP